MNQPSDGFHLLADELNASTVKDIFNWKDHPELSRLLTKLLSHTSRKPFLDSFAEAMVARHLLAKNCRVRFEIPTPQGKRSDFEVEHDGQKFYMHVKRIDTDRPQHGPRQMRSITARLRMLERIPRPYIVQVRWDDRVSTEQIRSLVTQAEEFIRRSHVGDEMIARDERGKHYGGVRIIAPWEGDHVNVTVGLRGGFIDQAARFRKMLERAHQQFMPRAANVTLICSDHVEDVADFENALLGSHVERWDAFPPRGRRVAHGRAEDGFWHAGRFAESRIAGWFQFLTDESSLNTRLWERASAAADGLVLKTLHHLFDANTE